MLVFSVRNAHAALPEVLDRVSRIGVERESRDGPVLVFPEPCTIVYDSPMQRVLFWEERDTNPFFNLIEALWMMAGRRDVKFVSQFVKRMASYSDNGKFFHAAYGHRWRKNFGRDQLPEIIAALKANKDCRRQMLGIWDTRKDLARIGKDLPCNVGTTFQIDHNNKLNMVVHNRSNDIALGALNTNAVHFSILQEYIAKGVGVELGKYWQVSSNLHIYTRDFDKYKSIALHAPDPYRTSPICPYEAGRVHVTHIVDIEVEEWDKDLAWWMKDPIKHRAKLRSHFFLRVATPMLMAHKAYKNGDIVGALEIIETQMPEKSDWKLACLEWLNRRNRNDQSK
jgi:thymidylate synthase